MKKTFRIGLVYINTNNIGDIVIFDSVKYLVERSLRSMHITDYEIIPIDMGEKVASKIKAPQEFIQNQQERHKNSNKYIKEWKTSNLYYYFAKKELPKVEFVDLIIFGGGGLIKFHQQFFHMYIDEITSVADKFGIPVIFNAVGIEGYSEKDARCQILKTAINRKCVKAVTTRDNLQQLRDKYIVRRGIKTDLVCDPAVWTAEVYGIDSGKRRGVGIGVIRPEIFALYGVKAPMRTLLEFYKSIIIELENINMPYKLFTNGARRDHKFIQDLKTFMKRGEEFNKYIEPIPQDGKRLAEMINTYERIITCRMHAAVIAYALEVPTVTVVWNRKLKYFAEITKQPQNLIISKEFDNKKYVMHKILQSVAPTTEESFKQSDYIFLKNNLNKYYKRRYIVKANRFILAARKRINS